jgi:hypothetical protein
MIIIDLLSRDIGTFPPPSMEEAIIHFLGAKDPLGITSVGLSFNKVE